MRKIVRSFACLVMATALFAPSGAEAKRKPRPDPVPSELRGSKEARRRENEIINRFGLHRYRDAADIKRAVAAGTLVRVLPSSSYVLDETIGEMDPTNRELYFYALPQVHVFLLRLAHHKDRPPGTVLKLTSFVRSYEYQRLLQKTYPNAASSNPKDLPSSHLSGATLDISTKGMSAPVQGWLRKVLVEFERNSMVQATEETGSSQCFHVAVSPVLGAKRIPAPH